METWLTYFFLMILLAINVTVFFVCVRCLIDIEEIRIVVKGARSEIQRVGGKSSTHFDKSKVKYTDGDNT